MTVPEPLSETPGLRDVIFGSVASLFGSEINKCTFTLYP